MYHELVTGPATEPVTASDVKLYARVSGSTEDALINTWIKAGRIAAEDFQNRAYIEQTWRVFFDAWPTSPFDVPRAPLIETVALTYYDTDETLHTFAEANYIIDTAEIGRISLQYGLTWPTTTLRPINGVSLAYKAGYSDSADDVPDDVKDAIYLYCAYRYENRAGEEDIPKAFYDILAPRRIWTC